MKSACDYRYVTHCSARNWVDLYHPYFVLHNNLDQGIGHPNFENVVAPLKWINIPSNWSKFTEEMKGAIGPTSALLAL